MIELGDEVKERVTGLRGIVVGTTCWLNGCVRHVVQPAEIKDGKPVEATSFDEGDLEVVQKQLHKGKPVETGGPMPEPGPR